MQLKKIKEIFSFEKGSLQSSKCTAGIYNFITASSEWKTHNSFDYDCEALVVAVAASGSLGRVHYVNDKFISSDLCFILKPKDSSRFPVNLEFYYSIFKSLKEDLVKSTATGTAKKSINKTNFGNYVIPYYNIEEQNRLKPVFEKVADNSEKINQELSNQKQLVSKLKQAILQESIQGKLTQKWRIQNSNIKPAQELLNKIKAQKKQLIKDKKIRKDKPLPQITEDEIPFELPKGWVWCRLGELYEIVRGSSPRPKGDSRYWSQNRTDYHWITIADFKPFTKNGYLTDTKGFLTELGSTKSRRVSQSDIIIACSGVGSVGKSVKLGIEGYIYDGLLGIRNIGSETIKNYLSLFIKNKELEIYSVATGANWLNINTDLLKSYIVPLPPKEEQKAIVEKVKTLMQKCNALELEITQSEQHANMLMQAVLKEAFESKTENAEEYANA